VLLWALLPELKWMMMMMMMIAPFNFCHLYSFRFGAKRSVVGVGIE